MTQGKWLKLAMLILLVGIMLTGYGGMCGPKKPKSDSSSGSSGASYNGNTGSDPGAIGNPSFSLVWNFSGSSSPEGPDIDIWVRCPNGHKLSTSPQSGTYYGPYSSYGVVESEGGQIDYDDMGGWGQGDGGGAERAYWPTGQAPLGTYTYGLRYYGGDGTVLYTMRVRYLSDTGNIVTLVKMGELTSKGSEITLGTYIKF